MLIEAAVGASVAWLWGKLADAAESQDTKNDIQKALGESIEESYKKFENKYPDLSESFFNQEFLEKHICPEVSEYLTRNQYPDIEAVANAFPNYVVLVSEDEYKDEINEFFDMVMDSMKKHAVLQDIINNRQIDETNQIVKNVKDGQKTTNKLIEDSFNNIAFEQEQTGHKVDEVRTQNIDIAQQLSQIQSLLTDKLPASKGNELNKILAKQLDRARDFIIIGKVKDAHDLLMSLEDEVSSSDDYTRFRWYTNLGACALAYNNGREAAEHYLTAYDFAKDEEKAVANKIRAFLLIDKVNDGLKESEKALDTFPKSGIVWALHMNAKKLLNIDFDSSMLPNELQNDSVILLMLSDLQLREKEFEESFNLARKAFEQDKSSLDEKRAMLASALSWATADTVKSHYKQFGKAQYDAIKYAVDSFDDIIPVLKNLQSQYIFTEVAHNLIAATELLGDEATKNEITSYAFSIYPDENAFVWYRIKELKISDDVEAIHKLTDRNLGNIEKQALFLLAEISANSGDLKWNGEILKSLEARELDKRDNDELLGIKICALWKSGDKSHAIELARDNITQIKSYPSLLSFYIRLLGEYGETEEQDDLIHKFSQLPDDATSLDNLQFADLLYDHGRYFDAANLFMRLVESPSDDYLTKRYLDSLIKSDQRAKATAVLEDLPTGIREKSVFRRVEANLARSSGDLDKLEDILEQELQLFPFDSGIAAGYIATLYRKNKSEELHTYLTSEPIFDPIIEENEIEIAKYQMEVGLEYEAMLRMYSLFRAHSNSSIIAGHYLLLMLIAKQPVTFKPLEKVTSGAAVYFEYDGHQKTIVIEPKHLYKNDGWPECISEDDDLSKNLTGLSVGDQVDIETGFGLQKAKITNIESMFIFASNNAHKVVADSASSVGPVWSVNVKKPDGEYDFSQLLKSLKSRQQHVEHVFTVYSEKRLPLQIMADALGTDIVALLLEWPYKQFDLFVSPGAHEERENLKELINEGGKSYVLDLSCLVELARLDLLDSALVIFGKPLITVSLREQLLGIIQIHNKMSPAGTASEIGGQINYQEIPIEYLEYRKEFLNTLLDYIDNYCEVVPVIGPDVVTEQQASIGELLGHSSQDAIYLALERNAILVTEDGGFRSIAISMGVTSSTWLQPLLMVLRDKNAISEEKYSESILDKLKLRHDFTSVTADDLLYAAKKCPNEISPEIESVMETFMKPLLDLSSGVVVGSQLLKLAAKHVNPNILYQYYKIILDALSFGRANYSASIHESLRAHIVSSLPGLNDKKAKLIGRKFGDKLAPPKPSPIRFNPITLAVRMALNEWR